MTTAIDTSNPTVEELRAAYEQALAELREAQEAVHRLSVPYHNAMLVHGESDLRLGKARRRYEQAALGFHTR